MNYLVSINVALYNNEKYIGRCLDSILSQTYKYIEIIVVDDGSTDESRSICMNYPNIRYIRKTNGGLSSARQLGLENSTGDYICFVDADDYLENTYVERLLNKCIKYNSDICVCSTLFVDENGHEIKSQSLSYHCLDDSFIKLNAENINTGIVSKLLLSDSWNKIYRLNFIKDTGVSFCLPKGFNGSDLAFNNKLALYFPSYSFVDTCEYIHVIYGSSAVHRKNKRFQEGFEIIVDDILKQSNKIIDANFDVYISNLYYRLLRKSFQDVIDESKESENQPISVNEMLKRHRDFVSKRKGIYKSYKYMYSKSLKVFVFLCDYFPVFIKPYLLVRRLFTSTDS